MLTKRRDPALKSLSILVTLAVFAVISFPARAVCGEEAPVIPEERGPGSRLYEQRGCGACHAPERDQTVYGLGPSLKQIAEAYKGREDQLVSFLQGACDPILDARKQPAYPVMHGQIVKLRDLSPAELHALARYIFDTIEKPGPRPAVKD